MMEKNNKIFEVKDIKENILELHFFQGQSDYLKENNIKEDERKNAVKAKIAEFFNMKMYAFSLVLVPVVLRFPIWQVFMQKLKRL